MKLNDLVGWLVRKEVEELRPEHDPLKDEVIRRLDEAERRLEVRRMQRDIIKAQVRAIGGEGS